MNKSSMYSWYKTLALMVDVDEYKQIYYMNSAQGNGVYFLMIYDRICKYVLNTSGAAVFIEEGNERPLTIEEISKYYLGNRFDISTVQSALMHLTKYNLLVLRETDGAYVVNGMFKTYKPLHIKGRELNEFEYPITAGTSSQEALYKKKRREHAKEVANSQRLLLDYSDPDSEVVPLAKIKTIVKANHSANVTYWVRKLGFEKYLISIGKQKKGLLKKYADVVIAAMKGRDYNALMNEQKEFNGFNGDFNGDFNGTFNNEPLKIEYKPLNEPLNSNAKSADKQGGFNGLTNVLQMSGHLSTRGKEDKNNIDDDYITNVRAHTRIKDVFLKELYGVGFDEKPGKAELAALKRLYKSIQYPILLEALKQTRRFGGNSIVYTQKIIEQILDADLEIDDFDPDRDITDLLRMVEQEAGEQDELAVKELKAAFVSAARFWTDLDLVYALRELSGEQDFTLNRFKKVLDTQSWKYDSRDYYV